MDLKTLSRELIRALRGRRSQTAFSRRLGYKSNVAYAWESGRRAPSAAETMRAARRVGIEPAEVVRRFYRAEPAWLASHDPATAEGITAWLSDLRGDTPVVPLAEASGLSRFSVARALSGEREPSLEDFLRLVEAASLRALDLCAAMVDPALLSSAAERWRRLEAQRRLAFEQPYTQAVQRALELRAYADLPHHEDGWIAARLGFPAEAERACLDALVSAGEIRWDGRRYRLAEGLAVDTRSSAETSRRLKVWWAEVGLARLLSSRARDRGREPARGARGRDERAALRAR